MVEIMALKNRVRDLEEAKEILRQASKGDAGNASLTQRGLQNSLGWGHGHKQ